MPRRVRGGDALLVALAGASLLVAGAIYVLWRSGERLHGWVEGLDPFGLVAVARSVALRVPIPPVVANSLPDALWQGSFALLMLLVWRGSPLTAAKVVCCCAPVAIGLGLELGQALGVVEGTFDPIDLALGAAAALLALVVVRLSRPGHPQRA